MLARLDALSGVHHAGVDYHGDLLKLAMLDEAALGSVLALLTELGHRADIATEAEAGAVDAWYDTGSVGELSRVEAGVIADRIVSSFAEEQSLDAVRSRRVRPAVVDALHECFVSNALGSRLSPGTFRSSCTRAVEERVRPIVGTDSATALARLLSIDMSEDRRNG